MALTAQAVTAALRRDGHTIATMRGLSVERSGAAVRKRGSKIRVYYMAPVRGGSNMIERYAHTLAEAGFEVEQAGHYLNITKED